MPLSLVPVSFAEACRFIKRHHRHHLPPQGWKFGVAVAEGGRIVGVVTVGRPVSRNLDDGLTLEVTRCCTDGTKNAASMLYGAASRAAKALGYRRVITYTLGSEPGTTLTAAGWRRVGRAGGGSWNCRSRPRTDKAPTEVKTLWGGDFDAEDPAYVRRRVVARRQRSHTRLVTTRPVVFTCQRCGEVVEQERMPGPIPRYCTPGCRAAARRDYQRDLMRGRRSAKSAQ